MTRLRKRLMQVICDIILYFTVCVPLVLVVMKVEPTHRGFYCNDESIRYPYADDSVTVGILLGTCLGFPLISFVVVELVTHYFSGNNRWGRRSCKSIAKLMGLYMFGLTVTMGLTEAGKLTVGRLRPHFIDVCQPDFNKINCSQGYIRDALCTNSDTDSIQMRESRKSFPSGHSSLAFYLAMFLGYYFQERVQISFSVLLRPVLQAGLVLAAVYCSLSRVMDHKHHPGDVAGGAALGLIVGAWMIFTLSKSLGYRELRLNYVYKKQMSQDSTDSTNFDRLHLQYNHTSDDNHCLTKNGNIVNSL